MTAIYFITCSSTATQGARLPKRELLYYWQSRYTSAGAAGLVERSRAPHHTRIPPVSDELRAEVLAYRQTHASRGEGYRATANAIGKAHNWHKVIGATKVRDIALAARETQPISTGSAAPLVEPSPHVAEVVHAPQPNQTMNIDLCGVPLTHDGTQDLMSVSVREAEAGVRLPDCLIGMSRPDVGRLSKPPSRRWQVRSLPYILCSSPICAVAADCTNAPAWRLMLPLITRPWRPTTGSSSNGSGQVSYSFTRGWTNTTTRPLPSARAAFLFDFWPRGAYNPLRHLRLTRHPLNRGANHDRHSSHC